MQADYQLLRSLGELRSTTRDGEDIFEAFRRTTLTMFAQARTSQARVAHHTGLSERMVDYWRKKYGLQQKQQIAARNAK